MKDLLQYTQVKLKPGTLARSESSLRCDLAKWGLS
jgi:hypothetical protein